MIRRCSDDDLQPVYEIINDAAVPFALSRLKDERKLCFR